MRYSIQRENIKKGLERFCVHPTAEELYLELKNENPKLSLATVYRNLNQLAQTGDIKRIDGLSEQVHYDHNTKEHFHMICSECNKIIDIDPEVAESLKQNLEAYKEFELLSYDILIKGICKDCLTKLNRINKNEISC